MAQKKKRKSGSIEAQRRLELANCLFRPVGKNPYYLFRGMDCIAINDLAELHDRIALFTENEADWVASWIEYLGDNKTADKIRATPTEIKKIVTARYEELRGL